MRRFFSVLALALSILNGGCESGPVAAEYSSAATDTPMSPEKHASIVKILKTYVAKNYNKIPLIVYYADLDSLPKLRKFLLGLGFIYRNGVRWRFTKKAFAQANDFSPDWVSFYVAHGTYEHFGKARLGLSGALSGGELLDVTFYIRSTPTNKLGRLFAASQLLLCVEGYQHHKSVWGNAGVATSDLVSLDADSLKLSDNTSLDQLSCPETRDR